MSASTPHCWPIHLLSLLLSLSLATACEDDPAQGVAASETSNATDSNTTSSNGESDSGTSMTGGGGTTGGELDSGMFDPDVEEGDVAVADTATTTDSATMEDAPADSATMEDTAVADTAVVDSATMEDTAVADTAPPEDTGEEVFVGGNDPYEEGELAVATIEVGEDDNGAPVPMEIYTPTLPGTYAVLVFQHGFILTLDNYTQLLSRIASHGFVVVSPTMYNTGGLPFGTPTVAEEVTLAQELRQWVDEELSGLAGVDVDLSRVGYIGHSRGGKVAWSMLVQDPTMASAIAGIDPVDGTGGPPGQEGPEERVVMGMFDINIPTLVIGTGLGPTGFVPCAPEGDNYIQFYEASPAPAWEIVVTEYGHLDMVNDNCGLSCIACPRGDNPPVMRTLTAAMLTAFFRASLQGDESAYELLTDTEAAITPIETRSR